LARWADSDERPRLDRSGESAVEIHAVWVVPSPWASLFSPFRGADRRRWAVALPLLLGLSVYYLFEVSVGTFRTLAWNTDYYDLLCEGFRQGHLYVPVAPKPELLAKADPLDNANMSLWLWDVSLYRARYYMYWGPVPALFLLAFKWVTGFGQKVMDQWLALVFWLGRLYGGAALILGLASHARTRQPAWVVGLAILVFGVAHPTPYLLARSLIYEACTASGHCFLFWGLAIAFWGLVRPSRRMPLFALAGVLWALAVGSRVTLTLSIPWLILLTAWWGAANSERGLREMPKMLLALGLPVGLCLGGYAIYNYLRFDKITEFGVTYQATGMKFSTNRLFVIPNVFSYLFADLEWSCRFPFTKLPLHRPLSKLITWPPGYDVRERIGGLVRTVAWSWLLVLWVWRPIRRWLSSVDPGPRQRFTPELWAFYCSLALLLSVAPALGLWEPTSRYFEDPMSGILVASTLAGFWLLRRTGSASHGVVRVLGRVAYGALGVQTLFLGVCLGFSGFADNFEHANPALYQSLQQRLSMCREAPP
jgi:hypothetical protein